LLVPVLLLGSILSIAKPLGMWALFFCCARVWLFCDSAALRGGVCLLVVAPTHSICPATFPLTCAGLHSQGPAASRATGRATMLPTGTASSFLTLTHLHPLTLPLSLSSLPTQVDLPWCRPLHGPLGGRQCSKLGRPLPVSRQHPGPQHVGHCDVWCRYLWVLGRKRLLCWGA
jgi:hypothetical protein